MLRPDFNGWKTLFLFDSYWAGEVSESPASATALAGLEHFHYYRELGNSCECRFSWEKTAYEVEVSVCTYSENGLALGLNRRRNGLSGHAVRIVDIHPASRECRR
jgi:hypothetical protein